MRLPLTALRILAACAALGGCGDDSTENDNNNSTGDFDGGSPDSGGRIDASTPPASDSGARPDAAVKVDASVDAGPGPAAGGALCHLAGNQIAVIGDSYIQLSGDFTRMLQDHARKAKALGETDTYVDHSLSGASMNGFPAIPPQLDDAIADAKTWRGSQGIKLVIMDGGGNDVLVNARQCLEIPSVADVDKSADCVKVVDNAMDAAQKLFDHGVEEGVQGVVYFFYPHLPKDSLGAGPNANNILDYSIPRAKALCEKQTKAPCFFVDMRPAFNDPMNNGWPKPGLIAWDGIHPTGEGSQVLADEVWKVMQANCLASQ